jgi:hypothetical protein
MYTSKTAGITQFGFQDKRGYFPYSDRLNQIILDTISDPSIPTIIISCISPHHREIQRVNLKQYTVERVSLSLLDDDNYDKERFYGLIGKQGEDWVRIVPDIEYPDFTVEYIGVEPYVHYFRTEDSMAITKDGILVMYSDEILFTINEILTIGKMAPHYRKMIIRHIPFGVKFYYSPSDKEIKQFEDSDIQSEENDKNPCSGSFQRKEEENRKFIYRDSSNKEKIYLNTIKVFVSFSPETRKKIIFEKIYDELIQKSYEPTRYYNWCLDEEDRLRISKLFIV